MTQKSLKTRLGKRLNTLLQAIPHDSDVLYDLCCDHGAIGRASLESQPSRHVVFNDIHPDIMARLKRQLESFHATNYSLQVCPAQALTYDQGRAPTFLLAGIGDEQCNEILNHLLNNESSPLPKEAVFIVSPATKVHHVRSFLRNIPLQLLSESVVTENKRSYEILIFKKAQNKVQFDIDAFGKCWQPTTEHRKHLKKLIQFYGAQQGSAGEQIAEGYANILKKLSMQDLNS